MHRDGMDTVTGLSLGGIHTPTQFFLSRWERLLNWNRNPGGVILERQAKSPGQFGSGQHQDGNTDGQQEHGQVLS